MDDRTKIMKLIAGVKTKKQMEALWKYFRDNDIDIGEDLARTAINQWSMLPSDTDETV
jgi:hypothetical protein